MNHALFYALLAAINLLTALIAPTALLSAYAAAWGVLCAALAFLAASEHSPPRRTEKG